MTSKTTFFTNQQAHHLNVAAKLTNSEGFMADAVAVAAYRSTDTGMDMQAVAVFECFRGSRAEMHFGCTDGHRLTPELITTIVTLAFHPKYFGLDRLMTRVPARHVHAICTLLKIGFQIEHVDRGSLHDGSDGVVLSLNKTAVLEGAAHPSTNHTPRQGGNKQE